LQDGAFSIENKVNNVAGYLPAKKMIRFLMIEGMDLNQWNISFSIAYVSLNFEISCQRFSMFVPLVYLF
jgi:hypothetical protein